MSVSTLAGVCGWPVHHSRSPTIHNFWLRQMRLSGAYVQFAVRPDRAERAFRSLTRTSIAGVNVTVPLKEHAARAADRLSADAKSLGAANCLYVRGGELVGHNTDMEGFAAPLLARRTPVQLARMPATVIGTGGAARAVVGALLALNMPEIRILGRTDGRAQDLAAHFNLPSLYALPWARRHDALAGAGLIVNATSAGMGDRPALDLDLDAASPGALVYDLVYIPRETPLIADARWRGLDVVDGMEMLIAQARPSFRLFYGRAVPGDLDPTAVLERALGQ